MSDTEILFRLIVACILGGIVGYERQSRNKSAGLRTHILVSLGACLIMLISGRISIDGRIAAQVVSGIGFLGAGSILANRQGLTVIGLTTAASLWVVAAIGLAVGGGFWFAACTTTALVYITLAVLSRIESRMAKGLCCPIIAIVTTNQPGQLGKIGTLLGGAGISIQDVKFNNPSEDTADTIEVELWLSMMPQAKIDDIVGRLAKVDGIISVQHRIP